MIDLKNDPAHAPIVPSPISDTYCLFCNIFYGRISRPGGMGIGRQYVKANGRESDDFPWFWNSW